MRLYLLSCPRKNIVLSSSSKNYSFSYKTGAAPALLFRVRYVSLSLPTAISHTVVEMNLDLIFVSVSVSFTGVLVPSVGGLECPPKCRDPPMNNFRWRPPLPKPFACTVIPYWPRLDCQSCYVDQTRLLKPLNVFQSKVVDPWIKT